MGVDLIQGEMLLGGLGEQSSSGGLGWRGCFRGAVLGDLHGEPLWGGSSGEGREFEGLWGDCSRGSHFGDSVEGLWVFWHGEGGPM